MNSSMITELDITIATAPVADTERRALADRSRQGRQGTTSTDTMAYILPELTHVPGEKFHQGSGYWQTSRY